jgi:hypothetical protein
MTGLCQHTNTTDIDIAATSRHYSTKAGRRLGWRRHVLISTRSDRIPALQSRQSILLGNHYPSKRTFSITLVGAFLVVDWRIDSEILVQVCK